MDTFGCSFLLHSGRAKGCVVGGGAWLGTGPWVWANAAGRRGRRRRRRKRSLAADEGAGDGQGVVMVTTSPLADCKGGPLGYCCVCGEEMG